MKGLWIYITLLGVLVVWTASGAVRVQGNGDLSGVTHPALKQIESNKAKQAAGPEAATRPADSLNIEYLGQTGGEINYVTLQGNYAYVNEGQRLTILDISVPGSVALVGRSSYFSSGIGSIAVAGDYAYLANFDSGLRVLDISNPVDPVEVSIFDTPGAVNDVTVAGNYAYLADYASGEVGRLRVLDVSDPGNPIEVGFLEMDMPERVVVTGSYAYVVQGNAYSMLVVDISNPSNPVEVGSYDPSDFSTDVAVVGDYAYLATWGSGLRILDVSDPINPTEIGSFTSSGNAVDIAVQGNYAYLPEINVPRGLRIVDVSDPTNPIEAGFHPTYGAANGVAVKGDYAYLASSTSGLIVVDVIDPAEPVETDYYIAPAYAVDLQVVDGYAYVADNQSGLLVIDVSNPVIPLVIGWAVKGDYPSDVAVQGIYAYVADPGGTGINPTQGMHIVDVSNPVNPTEISLFNTPGQVLALAVAGNYAYVADSQNGLRVVDVSDPANPVEVGFLDTGNIWSVAVAGDYAYLGVNTDLSVVNISDPTQPVIVGGYSTSNEVTDVAVIGDYAYVANWRSGLRIVDVTNPASPKEVGYYITPEGAASVAIDGSNAYVAAAESGLRLINISDPANPVEVGYYDTPDFARNVSLAANLIYVADRESGLIILRYTGTLITTTTSITSDEPDPSLVSQPFTVTFGVTSTLGIPTGAVTVTVSESAGTCSAALVGGLGACQMALRPPGTYTLTATYAGEGDFQPSSDGELHTVNTKPAITTTTRILSDSPDPSLVGQPFTVTFGVTSTLGAPTGVVTVTVSESAGTCSAVLMGGLGACQMALSASGTYTLIANYAGEGDFLPSSASEQHTVDLRRVHLPLLLQNHYLCSDFFDDFSDPSSGWFTGEDSDVRAEYLNGEYSVLVKPTNSTHVFSAPTCDLVNYTVEVDVRWTGDTGASYGLIFGIQGDFEQFYSFEVNADFQEYALYRYGPGGWTEIVPITSGLAEIHPGTQTNHLKVTRNGNAITLEINGTTIMGTPLDGTITGLSGAGLIVSSYSDVENAEASFDNFRITRLASSMSSAAADPGAETNRQAQVNHYRKVDRQAIWQ